MISARFVIKILETPLSTRLTLRFSSRFTSRTNMVVPKAVAAELLRLRVEKAKSKSNTLLNSAELFVIGSRDDSFRPSLMVTSEGRSYLFNCNEGFQRLSYANKVKLLSLENAFVTNTDWANVSGAFGLALTLQDVGSPYFNLRGGQGIEGLFAASKTFMTFTSGMETNTLTHLDGEYQDSGLKVTPIPLEGSSLDSHEHKAKKSKSVTKLVAYLCLMPDLPGRLDALKCRELKIPIGPKLASLKNGQDVTLPDGRVIKSSDVCGPKNQGLHFIVIECPSIDQIDVVTNNTHLNGLRTQRKPNYEREIDMVIHFSPPEVVDHPKYQNWIDGFSDKCKHWLLDHDESNFINFEETYRYMYLYRKIDKDIFPELYLPEYARKAIDAELTDQQRAVSKGIVAIENETELSPTTKGNFEEMERVTRAEAFDKIVIRPSRSVEGICKKYAIDIYYRMAKLKGLDQQFDKHQELLETMPRPQEFEPELVFLGTGSAVPSKLRNTSCILFNLKAPREASVILDCGEDSYGQLMRHYGPEKTRKVLNQLKMIYISHHHADHHLGLIKIIKARRKLTDEPIVLLVPPGVDFLLDYHNKNYEDLSGCYKIFTTRMLKSIAMNPGELTSASRVLKNDLLRMLDGLVKDYTIVGVDHCVHSCAAVFSFNIARPGMNTFSLAYSGDARPSGEFIAAAQNCDLLIHEATFDHRSLEDALSKKHSTTHEAIEVGRRMNAKFTILTHFSQRFAKIPYFTDEFDDRVGFAFDNLTLRCPSHFPRLPIMKNLLQDIFDDSLCEIDSKHQKKEMRQRALKFLEEKVIAAD